MKRLVQMQIPEHLVLEIDDRLQELRTIHNTEVMKAGDDLPKLGFLARRGRRLTPTHMMRALIAVGLKVKVKPKTMLEILAADPLVRGRKEIKPTEEEEARG
jgi:molybdopterin biosynthesis enzyme